MDDDAELIRKPSPEELADVAAMHAANRAAWDEASERYEGWLDEAIALIRSGGTNLFGVEIELIGDLHGRCRRAIHLQCAGGRDTLSLWNQGADEVVGVDFSPRMLDLAARLSAATGAPARWVLADVLDTPHDLDGTRRPRLHRSRVAHLARRPRRLGGRDRAAAVARRPVRPVRGTSGGVAVRRRRRRPLDRHRLRLLRRGRGVEGLGARVHRPAVPRRTRPELEVRPGLDARRGHHGAARGGPAARARWPSIRSTGGAATATYAPTSAAGSRCRSRWSGAREPELRRGRDRRIGRPGRVGRARRPRSPRGRSARRCADRASPGRRSATGRRARRDRRSSARNGRGSAA